MNHVPSDGSWVELTGHDLYNTEVCTYFVFLYGEDDWREITVEISNGQQVQIETYNATYDSFMQSIRFYKIREDYAQSNVTTYRFEKARGYFTIMVKPVIEDGSSLAAFKIRITEATLIYDRTGKTVGLVFIILGSVCVGCFCTI